MAKPTIPTSKSPTRPVYRNGKHVDLITFLIIALAFGLAFAIVSLLPKVTAADHYREIYRMETLGEKRRRMASLTCEQRRDVWSQHFANVRRHFDVSTVQSGVLERFLEIQRTCDREAMSQLEPEALAAFDDDALRFAAFATIGPYREIGQFCKPKVREVWKVSAVWEALPPLALLTFKTGQAVKTSSTVFGNCPCSIGSSFNMSCTSSCGAANGACTGTDDGCGFGWLFACNGNCTQKGQLQDVPPGTRTE